MKTFLKFARAEARRLRREHDHIVNAASRERPHAEVLKIEQASAEARLWLADELESAAAIVMDAIATAKRLQTSGALE